MTQFPLAKSSPLDMVVGLFELVVSLFELVAVAFTTPWGWLIPAGLVAVVLVGYGLHRRPGKG